MERRGRVSEPELMTDRSSASSETASGLIDEKGGLPRLRNDAVQDLGPTSTTRNPFGESSEIRDSKVVLPHSASGPLTSRMGGEPNGGHIADRS